MVENNDHPHSTDHRFTTKFLVAGVLGVLVISVMTFGFQSTALAQTINTLTVTETSTIGTIYWGETIGLDVSYDIPSAAPNPPYKIEVDWGDLTALNTNGPYPAPSGGTSQFTHAYATAGAYTITAKMIDSANLPVSTDAKLVTVSIHTVSLVLTSNQGNVPWDGAIAAAGTLKDSTPDFVGTAISGAAITFAGTGAGTLVAATTSGAGVFASSGAAPGAPPGTGKSFTAEYAGLANTYTAASSAADTYDTLKHKIALSTPTLDSTSVDWGRTFWVLTTIATDSDSPPGPSPVAGLTLTFTGTAVDVTGGTPTTVTTATGSFDAPGIVITAPSRGAGNVGTGKTIKAHSAANTDYEAADSDTIPSAAAATIEITKRTPIIDLSVPTGVVRDTSLTATGAFRDPYSDPVQEGLAISFALPGGGIISAANTQGIDVLDASGFTIESCPTCTNLAGTDGTNLLKVHVGTSIFLPHDVNVVSLKVQGMGNNAVDAVAILDDDSTLPLPLPVMASSDSPREFGFSSSKLITQVNIISTSLVGISSIDVGNAGSDPQSLMVVDMADQALTSSPQTSTFTLQPGKFYSIGTSGSTLGSFTATASFPGNSDYLPISSAAASFTIRENPWTGAASPGGSDQSANNPAGQTYTRTLCGANDDTDYDGVCGAWETGGVGVPYTVNGVAHTYKLPTGTSTFLTGCGTGVLVPDATAATKDVYVEIDSMNGHAADCGAIADVITKFTANGINMHVLRDETGASIPHVATIGVFSDATPDADSTNDFDSIKANHFASAAERPTFTAATGYSIAGSGTTVITPTASGITMTTPTLPSGRSDIVYQVEGTIFVKIKVTLSSAPTINSVGTVVCSGCTTSGSWSFPSAGRSASAVLAGSDVIVTIKIPFIYTGSASAGTANLGNVSVPLTLAASRTAVTPVSGGSTTATTSYLNARAQVFHYGLWAHDGVVQCGPSGFGEGGTNGPANDFIVTMGCNWGTAENSGIFSSSGLGYTASVGTRAEQSTTFLHEFGHNLGLDHGGPATLFAALKNTPTTAIGANALGSGTGVSGTIKSIKETGPTLKTGSVIPSGIVGTITFKLDVDFACGNAAGCTNPTAALDVARTPGTVYVTGSGIIQPAPTGVGAGIVLTNPANPSVTSTGTTRTFTFTTTFSTNTAVDLSLGTFEFKFMTSDAQVKIKAVRITSGYPTITTAPTPPDSTYNCKPNYESIMSYVRQVPGAYLTAASFPLNLDYSHGYFSATAAPSPLNEAALNENSGLRSNSDLAVGTPLIVYATNSGSHYGIGTTTALSAPTTLGIDWNGNGNPADGALGTSYDLNKFTGLSVGGTSVDIVGCDLGTGSSYRDYDDWKNLKFNFKDVTSSFDGVHPPSKKFPDNTPGNANILKAAAHYYGGVIQPMESDGTSIFSLNQNVPIKFQIRDTQGNLISTKHFIPKVSKLTDAILGDDIEATQTNSNPDSGEFRWAGTQYEFNLKTGKGSTVPTAGTYAIKIYEDFGTPTQALLKDPDHLFSDSKGVFYTIRFSIK